MVITNHLSAILMGVVRQAVNRSAAASSGFMGSSWSLPHAASWIQFLRITSQGVRISSRWLKKCDLTFDKEVEDESILTHQVGAILWAKVAG